MCREVKTTMQYRIGTAPLLNLPTGHILSGSIGEGNERHRLEALHLHLSPD